MTREKKKKKPLFTLALYLEILSTVNSKIIPHVWCRDPQNIEHAILSQSV